MKKQIRAIGNNVNQVVQALHQKGNHEREEKYMLMKNQIKELENEIKQFFSQAFVSDIELLKQTTQIIIEKDFENKAYFIDWINKTFPGFSESEDH